MGINAIISIVRFTGFILVVEYMSDFTHFNEQGRARMVDHSDKKSTARTATETTRVSVTRENYEKIVTQSMAKGDVLAVAQVAGIMAAKKTSVWIPMCHPLSLKGIDITFDCHIKNDTYTIVIQAF